MGVIGRLSRADLESTAHDIVIVGGGIHGAMLHLESARRGLRSLLLEREDFGGGASLGTLRIVHGGLRHLQQLDLARCAEFTRERYWYLQHMRPLVEPLRCLLPLDGRGLRRPPIVSCALSLNAIIARCIHGRGPAPIDITGGRVFEGPDAMGLMPPCREQALDAVASWTDLRMPCPSRIVIETLKWGGSLGGTAANYVEAVGIRAARGRVEGVLARDTESGRELELRAPIVVDAAGPLAPGTLRSGQPEGRAPAVAAWNVLFDRKALSRDALALVDPRQPRGPMLFATALDGKLMVGTGYVPLHATDDAPWRARVDAEIDEFIAAVNAIAPDLALDRRAVLRVYAGVLPAAARGGRPRNRPVVSDHGRHGGPAGLYSLTGTKFTTARASALRVLQRIGRTFALPMPGEPPLPYPPLPIDAGKLLELRGPVPLSNRDVVERLAHIVTAEAVEHLDDLVLRRTGIGDDPAAAQKLAADLCALDARWQQDPEPELLRLAAALKANGVPAERVVPPDVLYSETAALRRNTLIWGV